MTVLSPGRDRTRLTGPFRKNNWEFGKRLRHSDIDLAIKKQYALTDFVMGNQRTISYRTTLAMCLLFGTAMGYFEASIVVYLRELYYPGGFTFPLVSIPARIIIVELLREFFSIIMLTSVAVIAGRRFWGRFGWFILMFGTWDIFYYVWLKAAIGWPATLVDWDILFLIPLPWIGPVLAPVCVAVIMIAAGISMTRLIGRGYEYRPTALSWMLALAATVVILYSFMRDTGAGLRQAMPEPYRWPLLVFGLILYITAVVHTHVEVMRRGVNRLHPTE